MYPRLPWACGAGRRARHARARVRGTEEPHTALQSRFSLEELVLAAEDRRHRLVGEDVHDRLGEEPETVSTVRFVRLLERVDRHRVRDDDAREVGLGEPLERARRRRGRASRTPRRRVAPCSRSACAPASSVPPVMITSSPTIAILSRTRPVISVTVDLVVRGPGLVHDREVGLDHLGEPDRELRAARRRARRTTTPSPSGRGRGSAARTAAARSCGRRGS